MKRSLDADGAGPNPAATQFWAYDEGINAVLQFDGSAATNISHRYLWSGRVDELFADEQVTLPSVPGNTLWGLADNLGTLRDIADFNETTLATTVTNHRTFNANGKLVAETNAAVDMLFAFTGKQLDDSIGLQHNLNRWYDANLGQWLSEDPLRFEAGDENVRRYVRNRGTTATDPSGLEEPGRTTDFTEAQKQIFRDYLDGRARSAQEIHESCLGTYKNLPAPDPADTAKVEFLGALVSAVVGELIPVVDLVLTAVEIYNEPLSPWSYAGLLPAVPAGAGKLVKKADIFIPNVAGRRGNANTRDHIDQVRQDYLKAHPDSRHIAGGRDHTGAEIPELYIPPLDGGRRGGAYPDLSFEDMNGSRTHINTVDTLRDGTLTLRERLNRDRIFIITGDTIITIPKPK